MQSSHLRPIVVPGLANRCIAVTGGASGIGRSLVMIAAASGAEVIAGDINDDALSSLAKEAQQAELSIHPVRLDVTSSASVEEFLGLSELPIMGVACSAGIAPDHPAVDMSLELWNKVISVNLTGAFLVAQAAARRMLEGGHGGSIVTVASAMASTGAVNLAHYSAAKGGVVALTKSMARELGPKQIRFNTVSPGGIDTPLYRSRMTDAAIQQNIARIPLGRLGQPEDVATCIAFLLSDLTPWVTGQVIQVNGGSLMA
jgi:NAD(P)-dependent dehydrogenase (short-subunit alcohol dehydrogenase family)